ncbi:hypothetical protein Z043_100197 [Scleropages formosus]|uniref:Rho GTPase-activating protein 42 n=1 Tax=Scleropages formosus TaxID=113540 RepID=A0A0P7W152_SCLFO|nr:hypothetical protein Z043_100197 [Scleropages formosus]
MPEEKKKFDKESEKYYSALEKHLNLSSKKKDTFLQEADVQIEKDKEVFYDASLEYVFKIQEVQEKKKFEFVEPLLAFLQGLFTFYHEGYELVAEFEPYKQQLQFNLQNTRNNFESTKREVEKLMQRMRSADHDYRPPSQWTMEGFLYVQEKRPLGFAWIRHYCTYEKGTKTFTVSSAENKSIGKQYIPVSAPPEIFKLKSCVRRKADSIDKRFCFDIEVVERHGVITLQALSESNRRLWMEAMDGREPIYNLPGLLSNNEETSLNETGFNFVKKCIDLVEKQGLNTVGLYRVGGVSSKVQRLMSAVFGAKASPDMDLDADTWDLKTITSGLKNYLSCLKEPLMTYELHKEFIMAVKSDEQDNRVRSVQALIHKLPEKNKEMLDLLINHLVRVSSHSGVNLMTVPNLGVIFGPTLLRSHEETVAAMMNIKFQNIVVEILIDNYELAGPRPQQASGSALVSAQFHQEPRHAALHEPQKDQEFVQPGTVPQPQLQNKQGECGGTVGVPGSRSLAGLGFESHSECPVLVYPSEDPRWLQATYEEKTGLIPKNYVVFSNFGETVEALREPCYPRVLKLDGFAQLPDVVLPHLLKLLLALEAL